MKRIWIAVFLLVLSAGLCTFEQTYIEDFCDRATHMAEQGEADELTKLWDKKNDIIYIFSEHDMVDDLAVSIKSLETADREEKEETLKEIKSLIYAYHENQRITFSNIF